MREIIRWVLGTWPGRTVSVVVHPANLHDRIGATLVGALGTAFPSSRQRRILGLFPRDNLLED